MAVSPRLCLLPILDLNGVPINGAKVYVYAAGTTTPLSLYSDSGLSSAADNPIIATQGFVPLRFMATASYKLTVTTSAGAAVTGYDGDNIDPGVAVGSGALPVANGGTAATTAAGARTNLAAAASTDMATAQSDIANLQAWSGYTLTTRTRVASGTTAQEPAAGTVGVRYDSTTGYFMADNGSAWKRLMRQGQALAEDFTTGKAVICVQRNRNTTVLDSTCTTVIPADTTLPAITEGDEVFSTTFTPLYSTSQIRLRCFLSIEYSTAELNATAVLFRNGAATPVAGAIAPAEVGSNTCGQFILEYVESPGATSAITYSVRCGPGSAATITINGSASTLGGILLSYLEIEEWVSP